MMGTITFNSKDSDTPQFLRLIGVPEEIISRGQITSEEMREYHISKSAFYAAAAIDRKPEEYDKKIA